MALQLITTCVLLTATALASLWVDQAPDHVRPYAIEHYANANALTIGSQTYRFPITGAASGNKFTLLATNAPTSSSLGVLPHIHRLHHENFFCSKGRFQLWTNSETGNDTTEARVMSAGDYGSVPYGTIHTFQILDPDTEMIGVIAPGSFEDLFFFLASENVTYATQAPYTPANVSDEVSGSADIMTQLETFDVYAQLNFTAPRDLLNGSRPASAIWHDGANAIPTSAGEPYFLAANWGPKYLNNDTGGAYQIVQPFVTPTAGERNFTQGTITLSRQFAVAPTWNLTDHVAFNVLEGAIKLEIGNETATLLGGDVAFVPGGTQFRYESVAAFSKFMYVCAGDKELDQQLLVESQEWEWPVFPKTWP